jgi:hypothetical protein
MRLQRAISLSARPVLTTTRSGVSTDELQLIWGAGIDGIIAGAGEEIGRLREVIDLLEPPAPRKRDRRGVVLPRLERDIETDSDNEEDEEEDY